MLLILKKNYFDLFIRGQFLDVTVQRFCTHYLWLKPVSVAGARYAKSNHQHSNFRIYLAQKKRNKLKMLLICVI